MQASGSNLVRVNGIELGYRIVGEGEPLVLLHGGFGSVEMFGPNVELAGRRASGHRRRPPVARALAGRRPADALRGDGRRHRGADRASSASSVPRSWASRSAAGSRCERRSSTRTSSSASSWCRPPFKRQGWYPEMTAGMDAMGPEIAGQLSRRPMYDGLPRIAPRVEDWPVARRQVADVHQGRLRLVGGDPVTSRCPSCS